MTELTAVPSGRPMTPSADNESNEQSNTDPYITAINLQTTKRGFWDLCRENPIADRGKNLQLLKSLFLTLIPIAALAAMCILNLEDESNRNDLATRVNNILIVGTQVGSLVHYLQRERDMTAMYVQSQQMDGTESRILLTLAYPLTNKALVDIHKWPWGETQEDKVKNKESFMNNLVSHRAHLEPGRTSTMDEIEYYTKIIKLFLSWFEKAIIREKVGNKWKALIAYKWLIECKEDYGKERTIGGVFFKEGGFSNSRDLLMYLKTYYVAKKFHQEAVLFQSWVEDVSRKELEKDRFRKMSSLKLEQMRRVIRFYNNTRLTPSNEMSTWWFDNMTVQIDVLFKIQETLTASIMSWILRDMEINSQKISISITLLCCIFVISPMIVFVVTTMISDIQGFARILSSQADALKTEKLRTNSLLYQMLPQPIAAKLKLNGSVETESFDDVTIFFSDIVDSAKISAACTPMQIVAILNMLYTSFDDIISKYNVYKIETIGDAYMVASGVPRRNTHHAADICTLALDLLHHMHHFNINSLSNHNLKMRVGINSGPVVAGIVGCKMPRYCLFGDTVNTASRMQTHGQENRIHISSQTKLRLDTVGGFQLISRGDVAIKGKGTMKTFWVMYKEGLLDTFPCMPGCIARFGTQSITDDDDSS